MAAPKHHPGHCIQTIDPEVRETTDKLLKFLDGKADIATTLCALSEALCLLMATHTMQHGRSTGGAEQILKMLPDIYSTRLSELLTYKHAGPAN